MLVAKLFNKFDNLRYNFERKKSIRNETTVAVTWFSDVRCDYAFTVPNFNLVFKSILQQNIN